MRIYILLIALFLGTGLTAQVQGSYSSSIGLSGGYVEDGYGAMFNYNYHIDRYSYFHIGIFAAFAEDRETDFYRIPYNVFTFQPGYYRRIYESAGFKPISIYLGLGAVGGYEVINNGNNTLPNGAIIQADSQFIYGGFAGAEFDYHFSNSFSLVVKANEYYHVNSDVGNWYPFFSAGIRFYLY